MAGILYGVGVGPGDPELLTIKALRIIRESHVVGIPAKAAEKCTAYGIAVQAVPEIRDKEILPVAIPMTTDQNKLEDAYERGFQAVKERLERGEQVAFLNLGDPSVYGTYMKLHEKALDAGYYAEVVSGVPSFCAAAGVLGMALGTGREEIHILPGYYRGENAGAYEGTRVLMKSAGKTEEVKKRIMELERERAGRLEVCAVVNCGMENQKIYRNIRELEEETGYFTTIIVKDGKNI